MRSRSRRPLIKSDPKAKKGTTLTQGRGRSPSKRPVMMKEMKVMGDGTGTLEGRVAEEEGTSKQDGRGKAVAGIAIERSAVIGTYNGKGPLVLNEKLGPLRTTYTEGGPVIKEKLGPQGRTYPEGRPITEKSSLAVEENVGTQGTTLDRGRLEDKEYVGPARTSLGEDDLSTRKGRSLSRRPRPKDVPPRGTTSPLGRSSSRVKGGLTLQDDEGKNKGKVVVQLVEGIAPRKVVCVASSSNTKVEKLDKTRRLQVEDIFKLPSREAPEEAENEEESVGNTVKAKTNCASSTRSETSAFMDMATEEELAELQGKMEMKTSSGKNDKKKGRGKNKGRQRQK